MAWIEEIRNSCRILMGKYPLGSWKKRSEGGMWTELTIIEFTGGLWYYQI
jgi:hypothetical protein